MSPLLHSARSADGTTITWTSTGDGPVLIHLPGAPLSNLVDEWQIPVLRAAYEALAAELRLIQFDARGTGHSQRDVSGFSLDAHVADLEAAIDAAGVNAEPIALLGFYGSVTEAIAYAARHPDHVSHLVLFGGAARGWLQMSGAETQALLSLIERDWNAFVESIAHAWLGWDVDPEQGRLAAEAFRAATTPVVARATLRAKSGMDVTPLLGKVRCPVLVLHRRDQRVIPLALSEELTAGLPNARLELLPGASATLFFEGTTEVVRTIVEFVRGRPAEGRVAASRRGPTEEAAAAGERARAVDGAPSREAQTVVLRRPLTPRELEVLRLIAGGESNAEIAHALGLSINTVERHVANVYRKIDARGRADATAFAVRQGLA